MNRTIAKNIRNSQNPAPFRNMLCALDDPAAIACRLVRETPLGETGKLHTSKLNERLGNQVKRGHIQGEQWYRNFADWVLISVNNPVHYRHPNSELVLLCASQGAISPCAENRLQVHYGVGIGETELEIVRWQLEAARRTEVAAIDANPMFLELFLSNLRSRKIETPEREILFKGYNDIFQNISRRDLSFANSEFKSRIHVCLGGTVGNFRPQTEIFGIFSRLAQKGDRLLLGFHLASVVSSSSNRLNKSPNPAAGSSSADSSSLGICSSSSSSVLSCAA